MSSRARTDDQPQLRRMIAAGVGVIRSYPGLAAALYGVQLVIAAVAAWIMANTLAVAFATRPLFDRAVDGDPLAQGVLLLDNLPVAAAVVSAGVAAALLYAATSWFLAGGLIATLIRRPVGRRAVVEEFGASGAATFFPYIRLWAWCLIPYFAALLIIAGGVAYAYEDLALALTASDVLAVILPTALPALALVWITALAAGYARVTLSLDRGKPAWRALVGGYRLVATRWRALVHSLLFALAWSGATVLYLLLIDGRALAGASGAVLLFALRQATTILRFAAKVAFVGGQVELARWGDGAR